MMVGACKQKDSDLCICTSLHFPKTYKKNRLLFLQWFGAFTGYLDYVSGP